MKKFSFAVSAVALSTIMWACGDSSSAPSSDPDNGSSDNSFEGFVESFEDLQVCTTKRNGLEILVKEENKTYICQDEKWVLKGASSTETPESSSDGKVDAPNSSSATAFEKACGDLWCGLTDTYGRVNTGYDEDGYDKNEGTSGYWYDFTDNNAPENGDSKIIYPPYIADGYGIFFGPFIETYSGIKFSAEIGSAYEYGYVGLGFNVVSENQEGGDISGWDGVCLTYTATAPFQVELASENTATSTDYGNLVYTAVASDKGVIDIPWSKFKMKAGWGMPGIDVDVNAFVKAVAAVKLNFTNSGDYYIQSVGRKGTCNSVYVSSSSVEPSSSSSSQVKGCGDLWCATTDDAGHVITGSDDETAGYWYEFTDEHVGGNSQIKFPSDVEELAGQFFCTTFSLMMEKYDAIKISAELGSAIEKPFAGIGFNIWSEMREGVDISDWEGVCIAYSSTGKFTLDLVAGGEEAIEGSHNFGYEVPKADSLTVINMPWSEFKQYDSGTESSATSSDAVKKTGAILLKFQESSEFSLHTIGRLGTCGS